MSATTPDGITCVVGAAACLLVVVVQLLLLDVTSDRKCLVRPRDTDCESGCCEAYGDNNWTPQMAVAMWAALLFGKRLATAVYHDTWLDRNRPRLVIFAIFDAFAAVFYSSMASDGMLLANTSTLGIFLMLAVVSFVPALGDDQQQSIVVWAMVATYAALMPNNATNLPVWGRLPALLAPLAAAVVLYRLVGGRDKNA